MAVNAIPSRSLTDAPSRRHDAVATDGAGFIWPGLPLEVLQGCRSALERLRIDGITSLGVVSSIRGEGRSTVAAGLALLEHRDRARRTVIVDLDLESPSLAKQFGAPSGPGVADIATGECSVGDCLWVIEPGLLLLPAGDARGRAPQIMSRVVARGLIASLMDHVEVVIADFPPLLDDGLGLAASRLVDRIVLVARAGVTPMPRIAGAVKLLAARPPVILNGTSNALPRWARRVAGDAA